MTFDFRLISVECNGQPRNIDPLDVYIGNEEQSLGDVSCALAIQDLVSTVQFNSQIWDKMYVYMYINN